MAYASEDMRLMGGVPGQQLFLYKTDDIEAEVIVSGYFDAAVEDYNLDTGDVIIAVCDQDGTQGVELLVATNTAGVVTTVAEVD